MLTYGQRQGDLQYNSVGHRRRGPDQAGTREGFSDNERLQYTAKDLRHVLNGDTLYAIMLGLTGTRDAADRSHAVDLSG